MGTRIDGVGRIAVLRPNSIGDFLCTLPALDALRAAYPDAELVLLGLGWHRGFLDRRPGPVDRVVVLPEAGPGQVDLDAGPAAVAGLRQERFDLALQMYGGGRNANPFLRAVGARVTAGLRAADAPPLDRWIPYRAPQSEIGRFLEVAGLVGAAPVTIRPAVAVTDGDRAEAATLLPAAAAPLVAVHPGANDARRRWPVERFAIVAAALAERGCAVVATGSAGDRELTAALAARAGRGVRDLGGELSLGGLAALFDGCALVLGNDTGPLHLARAVGAPTVTLYWAPNLVAYGPLSAARDQALVAWGAACPRCGADRLGDGCGHDDPVLLGIRPGAVLDAAVATLRRRDELGGEWQQCAYLA